MLRAFIEFKTTQGVKVILPLESMQLFFQEGNNVFCVTCAGTADRWQVPMEDLHAFQTCMRKAGAYITSVTEQKRLDENYPLSPAITPM